FLRYHFSYLYYIKGTHVNLIHNRYLDMPKMNMMTAEKQIPVEMKRLFGSYIMKMTEVPGRHATKEDKVREQKLFEMVDDYIEQA
ncbi:MAG: hypothetical protein EGR13_06670, partial [Coprococcus comes]|nr:hypothetical protein [Coprococcus comes]